MDEFAISAENLVKKFKLRDDFGILSYNDTPMKKFISEGITVISTDFKLMGQKAAEFALDNSKLDFMVPTELTIRESL